MSTKTKIYLILLLTKTAISITLNNQCGKIKGAGSPGNIIHEYFRQVYTAMGKKDVEKPITIISLAKKIGDGIQYKFIFKLKVRKRMYYIGMISEISSKELLKKNPKHIITNFIQSTDIKDIQKMLEIYSMSIIKILKCPFDLKSEFWNFVHKKAIFSKKNKQVFKKIVSEKQIDKKKAVFDFNKFNKNRRKRSKSKMKIFYKRKNQYKLGDVLSGSGKNKIMNPVKVLQMEKKRKENEKNKNINDKNIQNQMSHFHQAEILRRIEELKKSYHL